MQNLMYTTITWKNLHPDFILPSGLLPIHRVHSISWICKKNAPHIYTKSVITLGLGESLGEVLEVLHDLRSVGCDIVTIGQYLRPTRVMNLPVAEYIHPEVFERLRITALSMGFRHVASAPPVRRFNECGRYV